MATTQRRISVGPLIALVGALLLLVSLFLDWWEQLTAFTVFEVLDLALAVLAVIAILTVANAVGARLGEGLRVGSRALLPVALVALLIVVSQLLNDPPAVAGSEADPDLGIWLALAGALLMAAGSLLSVARISVALDVEQRERRAPAAADEPPSASEAPTRAAPPQPGGTEPRG